jgi:L-methionine (R)-S-oxide reductase
MDLKIKRYNRLCLQISKLLMKSPSLDSQLATINALLYHKIPYIFWVGFYIIRKEKLIVGPYQGPLACQELSYPNGACWHAVIQRQNLLIPDVNLFSGHISCDSRAKSEIVIPIYNKGIEVFGVLDVDSDKLNSFDEDDIEGLKRITEMIKVEMALPW